MENMPTNGEIDILWWGAHTDDEDVGRWSAVEGECGVGATEAGGVWSGLCGHLPSENEEEEKGINEERHDAVRSREKRFASRLHELAISIRRRSSGCLMRSNAIVVECGDAYWGDRAIDENLRVSVLQRSFPSSSTLWAFLSIRQCIVTSSEEQLALEGTVRIGRQRGRR